jgi:hypothetical protein
MDYYDRDAINLIGPRLCLLLDNGKTMLVVGLFHN